MKLSDILKSLAIIIIFAILYFSAILSNGLQDIKDNWPKYRCVPTYMPLAGYFGHDPVSNFAYCVGNIQKQLMDFFLTPVYYVLTMVGSLAKWLVDRIQFIRKFFYYLRNMVKNMLGDVYGMLINVLIQFQNLIIKTKDTIMKLIGTIVTFIYLIQGAIHTGRSIYKGPIGETLRIICFEPNTPVKLLDGTTKKMKDLVLGDILENNSEVYGTLKLKGDEDNKYYKIWSDKLQNYIYVTGEHKILNNKENKSDLKNYIDVKDYYKSEKTDIWDEELSCLITSNHQIPIGEFTFWDWED